MSQYQFPRESAATRTADGVLASPTFASLRDIMDRARVLGYKMNTINGYIDMDKTPEDKQHDMDELKRKEHEFLLLNASARNILLSLDQKSWDTLTSSAESCALFKSFFGWHPTEIAEKRPHSWLKLL